MIVSSRCFQKKNKQFWWLSLLWCKKLLIVSLYNHVYNLGETMLNEIGFKLGNIESRPKNIYYARFIMLIANHVAPTMVIDHPENQMTCWIQNKRLFKDLVRINLHEGTELEVSTGNSGIPLNSTSISIFIAFNYCYGGCECPHPSYPSSKTKENFKIQI